MITMKYLMDLRNNIIKVKIDDSAFEWDNKIELMKLVLRILKIEKKIKNRKNLFYYVDILKKLYQSNLEFYKNFLSDKTNNSLASYFPDNLFYDENIIDNYIVELEDHIK
jgi:hypothetical protein